MQDCNHAMPKGIQSLIYTKTRYETRDMSKDLLSTFKRQNQLHLVVW